MFFVKNKFKWTRNPDFKNIKNIDYDEYWKNRNFKLNSNLKDREKIIFNLIPQNSVVLDVGCGNSLLPLKLKENDCSVSIMDISSTVVKEFSNRGVDSILFDLSNINEISIDRKFDFIILSEVLEHTTNPEEILNKLKENTKYFIITIPNSAFYRYRFRLFFCGRFFTQWAYHPSEHLRFWSHSDFLDWLSAMGVEIIKSEASNGFTFFGLFPGIKNYCKNLFGHQIVYFVKVIN